MSEEQVITEKPVETPASWTSTLAPEYQSVPTFSKFKDVNDLAKSYVNLEKLVGLEKIPMPKDEKDEAGWATVYSRLGRPEAPEKYEVKLNLAEGLNVPEEAINGLKSFAHKAGLNNRQLQGLVDHWTELENQAYAQRLESYKQSEFNTETGLRKKLGANFEVAKKNAEAFIRSFAPKESQEKFLDSLKRDPELFEVFHNASKTMGEDVLKGGSKPIGSTPEEAKMEYQKLLNDINGPLYKETHPEHEIAVKRFHDLAVMMQAGS